MDRVMEDWQVTFWDVGQGDASTIRLPDGSYVLIDSGPLSRTGNPLPSWFARQGNPRIRLAVATHNHLDHFGGFLSLALNPNQQIDRFVLLPDEVAGRDRLPPQFGHLLDALKKRADAGRTRVEWARSPQTLHTASSLRLRMSHPENLAVQTELDANQTGMILALEPADDSGRPFVIWGADTRLRQICACCPGARPAVLMGPHHGKAQDRLQGNEYYKLFKRVFHPEKIFISVGRRNRYAHPDHKYLAGATEAGVRICCSEIADQCDSAPAADVFPGSALLGLPPPPRTFQCRGALRVAVSARHGVVFDRNQTEWEDEVVVRYPHAQCVRRNIFGESA